jgi:hypothetical protein
MTIRNRLLAFVCLFVLTSSGGLTSSAWAELSSTLDLDANVVPWTRLLFQAKGFSVDVTADVQLESLPSAEVEAALLESPHVTPIRPSGPESYKMTVDTTFDPIFLAPVRVLNRVWFDPNNASALGRIRLRRGRDDFKKVYRFTEEGVFRHRREPKGQKEIKLDPDDWTDIRDTFYAYDLRELECSNVSERLLLIYILSATSMLETDEPLSLCVFGTRQLHRVELRHEGLHSLKIDYVETGGHSEIHREGKLEALKIILDSQPMKSDLDEPENFSFLGFHRDIVLFIDPASNLPLQASGIISKFGRATLRLHKVLLK